MSASEFAGKSLRAMRALAKVMANPIGAKSDSTL
jgi:hypothetical protein